MTENGGAGLWLWVDPAREPGYNPSKFDQAAFLARAIARFQTRPEWDGKPPDTVRAHPEQAGNGLPAEAEGLGLEVKADPMVAPGTYRLGLGGASDGHN